jgi:hypothetical protein
MFRLTIRKWKSALFFSIDRNEAGLFVKVLRTKHYKSVLLSKNKVVGHTRFLEDLTHLATILEQV